MLLAHLKKGFNHRCVSVGANWWSLRLVHHWHAKNVRATFIEFFSQRDHQFVPSSSVIAKKNEGSYFVNAGMNQFKPLFLGTVDPSSEMASYQRVVNSQKCIRVGGKHNDLDEVGHDTYHHTFFEMLGNWSFSNYFKKEACLMSWQLCTEVFKLPSSQLFVTYFGGCQELDLEPDIECRDIWMEIGIPRDHILPFGMKDNFWMMGETGPCGPCTEIHYGPVGATSLVNAGRSDVMELWNLVFMQYDRRADGSLVRLPSRHVDTGLGLERLVAVLQGKSSNYDTDLFQELLVAISKFAKAPAYKGLVGSADVHGIDSAYRIVADHTRMLTVAIADGLVPGRKESEAKLRQIMYRCIHHAHHVLKAPAGLVSSLVPIVTHSLGDSYPEVVTHCSKIQDIVDQTEQRYLELASTGRKILTKVLSKYGKDIKYLPGELLLEIQEGKFGKPVPTDITCIIASSEFGLNADVAQCEQLIQKLNERKNAAVPVTQTLQLTQHDIDFLKRNQITGTDDSYKYKIQQWTSQGCEFEKLTAKVVALKASDNQFVDCISSDGGGPCGILLDQTSFYATAGGQLCDHGTISSANGALATVSDVRSMQQYVLHVVTLNDGSVTVGDTVELTVDKDKRLGCTVNHSATHILRWALNEVLGDVRQNGSVVNDKQLTFDFTCRKASVSSEDLNRVEQLVNSVVCSKLPVYRTTLPVSTAKVLPQAVFATDEVYPQNVNVISVGNSVDDLLNQSAKTQCSVELCGGTHVDNTDRIKAFVITNFHGSLQGTKRVTAVTEDVAFNALKNGRGLKEILRQVTSSQTATTNASMSDVIDILKSVEQRLSDSSCVLSKFDRDTIQRQVERLTYDTGISAQQNKNIRGALKQSLYRLIQSHADVDAVVAEIDFTKTRDMLDVVLGVSPDRPMLLLSNASSNRNSILGIAYVPKNNSYAAVEWVTHICSAFSSSASHSTPRGKYSKHSDILHVFTISIASDCIEPVPARVMSLAKDFIERRR